MSTQATSLSDFSVEFIEAKNVKKMSEAAQKGIADLVAGLMPRLMVVDVGKPRLQLEDLTDLYIISYCPTDCVHGVACFRVEPPKSRDERAVVKFFGIAMLPHDSEDVDFASEMGLRVKLLRHSRAFIEGSTLAKFMNLSTINFDFEREA